MQHNKTSCNTKLIHTQIIFMHTFLCFDFWTPTASAHVASASLCTYCHQWRSLGLFASEAIRRAQRGEKMLGGVRKLKKKWAIETHFPEFKWIIYDFNNNRNNTQKTISICVKWLWIYFRTLGVYVYMKLLPEFQIESISAIDKKKREDKIRLYLRADLSPA